MNSPPARKVILIAWDSADWNLVQPLLDQNQMPALRKLIESGASGRLATVLPIHGPIVWNSLATGKTADRHGVLGARDSEDTPTGPQSRRGKALWEVLSSQDIRTHVVGWPYTRSVEPLNGVFVHPRFATGGSPTSAKWPLPDDCVFPESVHAALQELRVHPNDLAGPALLPLVPRAREIDQTRDDSLVRIALALSIACSLHNAATWLLEHEPWDFLAVCSPAIGDVSRLFMQYHPPRMPGIDAAGFELFRDVVSGMYRFHDMLLARLMELAGPDATVILVSNHGFRSGANRAQLTRRLLEDPAASHRTFGIVGISGPGVVRDEIVHGASILDIAPTILALFGLPAGRDMSGNVLSGAWQRIATPARIETWDEGIAESGFEVREPVDSSMAHGLAHQFAGFQTLSAADRQDTPRVHLADRDRFNLASVYMTTGRPEMALPILQALVESAPEETHHLRALLQCYLAVGLAGAAKEVLRILFAGHERHAFMYYFQGVIRLSEGDRKGAMGSFGEVEALDPVSAFLPVLMGHCYAGNRLWAEAEAAYRRALQRDADIPEAHMGMAAIELHRKHNAEAASHALDALGLRYDLPVAHFQLATALARMGQYTEAELALRSSLRMAPGQKNVRRLLAFVLARKALTQGEAQGRETVASR